MTTAPSLTFATMEVPAVEDSMEMASPYQGQADDFDIDIDLMEDNVSNMDSDMMGADDYLNISQPSLFNTEVNDDADMADEPSEGSMVDAEVVDEDPDIDVQYEEATYEAEMLEGGQGEEVVASVPSIHVEAQAEVDEPATKPADISTKVDEGQDKATSDGHETVLPESTPLVNKPQEPQAQDEVVPPVSSEKQDFQTGQTLSENAELQFIPPDTESKDTDKAIEIDPSATEQHPEHVDASAENIEHVEPAEEAKSTAPETGDESVHYLETNDSHETEVQDTREEDLSLHPVKVLYQEAEISLFPPLEGDSAETFFLHDEDIAYDSIGKLFSCLREVLLDNVAENEVLVIDIDLLGIQLTEDSSHTSNMTLHQILNVYLRLCHNDGNNEPEALYLTLSSRLAVHSELASLEAAANEGKGLSQVHPWSEFEDGEDNDDSRVAENPVDGSVGEEDHEGLSFHEAEAPPREEVVPSGAADPWVDDSVKKDAQAVLAEVVQESVSDERDTQADLVNGSAETQQPDETGEADAPQYADASGHEHAGDYDEEQNEEQYDSEAPKTESTSTVVPASDQVGENKPSEDVSAGGAEDQLGEHGSDFQDAADRTGSGEDLNVHDSPEHNLYDAEGEEYEVSHNEVAGEEILALEVGDSVHPVDFASIHDENASNDPDVAQAAQDSSVDALHDIENQSNGQSESTIENPSLEESVTHDQAPEPEDELLGINADILEGTAQDLEDDLEHIESTSLQEEFEDGETDAPAGDDFTADDDPADNGSGDYDEESYNILEFSEHIELGEADPVHTDSQPHENPSKRPREEDEWDFEETSALDIKRRRPS